MPGLAAVTSLPATTTLSTEPAPSTLPHGAAAAASPRGIDLRPALTRQVFDRSGLAVATAAIGVTGLVAAVLDQSPTNERSVYLIWLVAMLLVLGGRFALRRHWLQHPELKMRWAQARWQFTLGAMLTAVLWSGYAAWLWPQQTGIASTVSMVMLCIFAAEGASALSPLPRLAHAYSATLLLPGAVSMAAAGGREHLLIGVLAVLYHCYLSLRVRVSHRHATSLLRLTRRHAKLVQATQREQNSRDKLKRRLDAASAALLEAKTRELRAREHALELEHQMQDRDRAAARLTDLATHDAVTRLVNRDAILQRLETAVAQGHPGVLFIDLDRFKEVNDAMGHFSGDVVLRQVSKRLKNALGSHGVVGRWGGDEFVAVIEESPTDEELLTLAEALRQAVSAPLNVGGQTVRIDACVGIARHPDHGIDAETLVRCADMAVYAAKSEGRGCARLFESTLAERSQRRYEIAQALRHVRPEREFHLVFQPLTSLHDGRLHALETLLRWHSRTLGEVTPAEFIPIAEESGAIVELGRWVLERACAAATKWGGETPPIVNVNVSVVQMLRSDFPSDVQAALERSGLPARRLEIEVTESVFAADAKRLEAALAAMRALGVRIAIDDFGTGYSSLAYLHRLQVDAVKIDQSFVQRLDTDGGSSIVTAIVSIARSFGIACVAEGVESAEQYSKLRELGVDLGQGWFFGRPMPAGSTVAEHLKAEPQEDSGSAQLALV